MTDYPHGFTTAPAAPLADLPDLEDDFDVSGYGNGTEGTESGEPQAADTGAGRPRPARPASNKAVFRRVAAKALEVSTAPDSIRALAAALTGSTEDPADLAAAIMTAPRGSAQALTDLEEVVEALRDVPWEAGVIAASMERPRLKAVWAVLYALEAVETSTPPARADKAGSGVVKAAHALTGEQKAELSAAAALLKRS